METGLPDALRLATTNRRPSGETSNGAVGLPSPPTDWNLEQELWDAEAHPLGRVDRDGHQPTPVVEIEQLASVPAPAWKRAPSVETWYFTPAGSGKARTNTWFTPDSLDV